MEKYEHGGNVYAYTHCLDFSANLNPLGMPIRAERALQAHLDAFARYPDPNSTDLVKALARFEHVPKAWVVPSAGATDALTRICMALRPRQALVFSPCYTGYEQALSLTDAKVLRHELSHQNDFLVTPDSVAAIRENIDIVFLANPNNPTGRCIPRETLASLLERAHEVGATVVLDECFIGLTKEQGSNDLLGDFDNLIVVKAFTKSFCLAGLRLGYALSANEQLVRDLIRVGQPWAVSVPAQVAGIACTRTRNYLEESRALIARERRRLKQALTGHGLHVVPSEANFLLFSGPDDLFEVCLRLGVLIRPCDNVAGLGSGWYRIAVRTREENDFFTGMLEAVLS